MNGNARYLLPPDVFFFADFDFLDGFDGLGAAFLAGFVAAFARAVAALDDGAARASERFVTGRSVCLDVRALAARRVAADVPRGVAAGA